MNCFAHALPFLDEPILVAGCCVPDWLSAADRKCRVHEQNATSFINHHDPLVANIARGIIQHHQDDVWFHQTPIFQQLCRNFTTSLRDVLQGNVGHRPQLLGHVLIELLLDGWLITQHPGKLEQYYDGLRTIPVEALQDTVNLMATKSTTHLTRYCAFFSESQFLFDYTDDEKLLRHVNAILKRVRQEALTNMILPWLGAARAQVYGAADELLAGRNTPPYKPS